MKKVSIAINVIMGLIILFLFVKINESEKKIKTIYEYFDYKNNSIRIRHGWKKQHEILKEDLQKIYTLNNDCNVYGSPIKIDSLKDYLFNENEVSAKNFNKYYCYFDTINYKFYSWNPRNKYWMNHNKEVSKNTVFSLNEFYNKVEYKKILKPNEDPNAAKDLRERK